MIAHVAGIAWITPLGADLDIVWDRLLNAETPEVKVVARSHISPSLRASPRSTTPG
jgi:hypothetical protein